MNTAVNTPSNETRNNEKLIKKLRSKVGNAIVDYNMIEEGDVVMVALSGGKDSYVMLDILLKLQKSAPIKFDVIAVNLDQKQPGFPEHVLPEYLASINVPYYVIDKDTYSIVTSKIPAGQKTCSLCSRMRRGSLYQFAEDIGATKIALGHHMDDIVETLFLNMFFNAKLKAMPPKLKSDDKRNVIIRPLAYCREKDIARLAEINQYPIIPCNLCGSQENLQRVAIKEMLNKWDEETPGRVENTFTAMKNVSLSQLADSKLFDFESLAIEREGARPSFEFDNATVSSTNYIEIKSL